MTPTCRPFRWPHSLRDGAEDRPALAEPDSDPAPGLLSALPGHLCCATGWASEPLCDSAHRSPRPATWRRSTTIRPRRPPSRMKRKHFARIGTANGGLRLAPTVGHLPDFSVVVQQSIHGQPLDALLQATGCECDGCRRRGAPWRRRRSLNYIAAPWSARGCVRWRRNCTDFANARCASLPSTPRWAIVAGRG